MFTGIEKCPVCGCYYDPRRGCHITKICSKCHKEYMSTVDSKINLCEKCLDKMTDKEVFQWLNNEKGGCQ